jgi:hypothetical protein
MGDVVDGPAIIEIGKPAITCEPATDGEALTVTFRIVQEVRIVPAGCRVEFRTADG